MNGWSCSPKLIPAHFTVLKTLLVWIVWSVSKTVELMAGPCSPKHGPVVFTVLKDFFFLDLLQPDKIIQVYGWAAFPNILVTAQLILRRKSIIWFWCCAEIHQRSNERLVVLPQTRSRAFHGVEGLFHPVGMKLFKNIRTYGWAVLPQTRLSFFHDVEEAICLDVLQLCK